MIVLNDWKGYTKESPGSDDIQLSTMKPLAGIVPGSMYKLLKTSIKQSKIPKNMDDAAVLAKRKWGLSSVMGNFGRVSLTNALRKMKEKLIWAHISQHLAEHPAFCPG